MCVIYVRVFHAISTLFSRAHAFLHAFFTHFSRAHALTHARAHATNGIPTEYYLGHARARACARACVNARVKKEWKTRARVEIACVRVRGGGTRVKNARVRARGGGFS